jgi:hypothetical protein
MKNYIFIAAFILIVSPCFAGGPKEIRLRMSMNDEFVLQETDAFKVEVHEQVMLRYANVQIKPKKSHSFDMMLFFKSDTKDLAQFNSPNKIASSVLKSSLDYMPYVVEKEIDLREANWKGQYGFYTILTDSKLINEPNIPKGQFKYLTRGMVRLSADSALGFSIMTNEINTEQHSALLSYIKGFIK